MMKSLRLLTPLLVFILFFVSVALAQQKTRKVDEEKYKKANEPLSVTYLLGEKPFLNRNETLASEDWLSNLTLEVKNISSKPITFFYIQLIVERQGTMEFRNAIVVSFPSGAITSTMDHADRPTSESKRQILRPGDTVQVRPLSNQFRILEDLKKHNVPEINSVSLDIRYVYYEDGSKWGVGIDVPKDKDHFIPDAAGVSVPKLTIGLAVNWRYRPSFFN
jgi:hypothetical protein